MTKSAIVNLEEAAEILGLSSFELKVSRQKGIPPGNLGFVEEGEIRFRRADLLGAPKTSREATFEPLHIGGGYFELSDGSRVRGKDKAVRAQALLEG